MPRAIAAFTSSSRRVTVVTVPMASIAIICMTSHRRSVVAVALSTSPAFRRER